MVARLARFCVHVKYLDIEDHGTAPRTPRGGAPRRPPGVDVFAPLEPELAAVEPLVLSTPQAVTMLLRAHHPGARRYMLRALRDTLIRRLEDDGFVLFHASAVAMNGRGVVIVGDRRAGKTTLMCHLLAGAGADFLGNDRVLVSPDGVASFVPLPVSIGPGTIGAVPRLQTFLDGGGTLSRQGLPIDALLGADAKVEFTPRELAGVLGARAIDACPLDLLVIAAFTPDLDGPPEARPIDAPVAASALRRCCFTPHDESWRQPWMTRRRRGDRLLEESAAARTAALGASVSSLRLRFGPGATSEQVSSAVGHALRKRSGSQG